MQAEKDIVFEDLFHSTVDRQMIEVDQTAGLKGERGKEGRSFEGPAVVKATDRYRKVKWALKQYETSRHTRLVIDIDSNQVGSESIK